jgi:hypothetical protein
MAQMSQLILICIGHSGRNSCPHQAKDFKKIAMLRSGVEIADLCPDLYKPSNVLFISQNE